MPINDKFLALAFIQKKMLYIFNESYLILMISWFKCEDMLLALVFYLFIYFIFFAKEMELEMESLSQPSFKG